MTATVQLLQSLTAEGQIGNLFAFAEFSDGSSQPLPAAQLSVKDTTGSLQTSFSPGSSVWQVKVAVGAQRECAAVAVEWRVCNATIASDDAPVNLELPAAVSLSVFLASTRLTSPSDTARLRPISLPTSTRITVRVAFENGRTLDFSTDERTRLSLPPSQVACARIDGDVLVVTDAALCSELTVLASVPELGGLSSSATATIVLFSALHLDLLSLPAAGSPQVPLQELRRLSCTDIFQRGEVKVQARLSDGLSVHVSSSSDVAVASASMVVERDRGLWIISASAASVANVTAQFHSESGSRLVKALDEGVEATALYLGVQGLSTANAFTLSGLQQAQRQSTLRMEFQDDTVLSTETWREWVDGGKLVSFESNNGDAVSVDSTTGLVVLKDNAATRTALSARSTCEGLVDSIDVAPNLLPSPADVDLGSAVGLQFQQSGEQLGVPVRANCAGERLINYQVQIYFDQSVFYAQSCSPGAVPGFACTIRDPLDTVKLIASEVDSQASGAQVSLGSFVLEVESGAVTLIEGRIVELVRVSLQTGDRLRTTEVDIVAGRGYASVAVASRKRRLSPLPVVSMPRQRRERRLLPSCEPQGPDCLAGHWGDVSGDCKLTSYDVLVAQLVYYSPASFEDLCPWKQQQLDPTLDGKPYQVPDQKYLLQAVANKYRFLTQISVDSDAVRFGTSGLLRVSVTLFDEQSEPISERTGVRFEIGYRGEGSPVYSVGRTNGTSSDGNWLATAQNAGAGQYQLAVQPATGWELQSGVGIAVLIETLDAEDQTKIDRNVAFLSSSADPFFAIGGTFKPLATFDVLGGPPQLPAPPSAPAPPYTPSPPA